ncbi:type II toxin-antitoxin system death-on-curing family toxin [Pollutibacter soli]|uniref:type II toxin-antitoxin system death-on-curing family toxin n=1 Tax=Pollutibacter soli TaxID=3034157 RepID=UPI003013A0DD
MISVQDVEQIHQVLISKFGGSQGIRDRQALESALSRPFQTFDGIDLYPDVITKGASLLESILINHPFVDGNKRTAYVVLRVFLLINGKDIHDSEDNKYELIINVASGVAKFDEIVKWLRRTVF